jgi:hypothetical protein
MLAAIHRFVLDVILRIDSQIFGLFVSFPVVFLASNSIGLTVSFLLIQITLREGFLAVIGFLVGNGSAYLMGGYLSAKLEDWHADRIREFGPMLSKDVQYAAVETEDDYDIHIEKTNYLTSLQYYERPLDGERPARNISFKFCLVFAVFIGNLMGSLTCGPIVKSFPTILLGWESIAEVEADYDKFH